MSVCLLEQMLNAALSLRFKMYNTVYKTILKIQRAIAIWRRATILNQSTAIETQIIHAIFSSNSSVFLFLLVQAKRTQDFVKHFGENWTHPSGSY